MIDFFMGMGFSVIITVILFLAYLANNKRSRAQEYAQDRFLHTDSLWYRTSEKEQLEFEYQGHTVLLYVKQSVFENTDRNCKLHQVFINNKLCGTLIKIRDSYQNYYWCICSERIY